MTQTSPLLKQLLGALVGIGIALMVYAGIDAFSNSQAFLIRPSSPIAESNVDSMRFANKNVDDKSVRQIAYRAQTLANALEAQTVSSSSSQSSINDTVAIAALMNARRDMRLENQANGVVMQPVAVQNDAVMQTTVKKHPALSQSGVGLWMISIVAAGVAGVSLSRKKRAPLH